MKQELLADPKERAEHLMLLDLGRNDVGRVAEIGSVKVTDQFFVERYSHVMHIVSNVEGRLRDGPRPARRACRRLSRRHRLRRAEGARHADHRRTGKGKASLYAGCVGYFSAGADMDTCIVLRTALIKDGTMYVQAGAGIVADFDPDFEQQECINKAKALVPRRRGGQALRQRRRPRAVAVSDVTPAEIVSFWREAGPGRWFEQDESFDLSIKSRFLAAA